MASIAREIRVAAAADVVWDAVRDVGALHRRVVPGMVTDVTLEPGSDPVVRIVTFADGMVLREVIVSCDDAIRRLVWAIDGPPVEHHNGAMQVFDDGEACRVVWTADVLPHGLAEPFCGLMEAGLAIMAGHLGR
ncbi:MAG: SRPBCC family protein [Sandarakinorhabdus sp.]|nr:SRPBCC family protein [Sandarakinorhabdus sp.]